MTQITTITPNPAIDLSTSVDRVEPFAKLRCAVPRRDPGGGGVNVARVVNRLGGQVTAIYPAGGISGQLLRHLLERENVPSLAISAAQETRQNVTIFEETTQRQFRFVMPGAALTESEWRACLVALAQGSPRPAFVVASGSLPAGVPDDFYVQVVRTAKQVGAKVIVDTSGPALKSVLRQGLYLIKPNLREFQELTGASPDSEIAQLEAGYRLIDEGQVEVIALSRGADGAILITSTGAWQAEGLPIEVASVVGAGDSFLGAMVLSLARGEEFELALRRGVAAGSAALISPGTELCSVEEAARLLPHVKVKPIARRKQH